MDEYYIQAISFCEWAKQLKIVNLDNADAVAVKLMEIYSASTRLQYPENFSEKSTSFKRETLSFTAGQNNIYWEIFNPYICDEPVCGCLFDDINDIYNDIQEGVHLYMNGLLDEADWTWKWNFENHWKYHAADAIRALCNIK